MRIFVCNLDGGAALAVERERAQHTLLHRHTQVCVSRHDAQILAFQRQPHLIVVASSSSSRITHHHGITLRNS